MNNTIPSSVVSSLPPITEESALSEIAELRGLSDNELLRGLFAVDFDSRKLLVRLLFFLAELERRRLHEKLAFTSLHDFCMRRLGMSMASAHRRVTATRLGLRFPLIFELLERGSIHMCTVLDLKPYLNEANHRELLIEAIDASKERVERIIAERFPKPDVESNIRPAASLPGDRLPPEGLSSPAFPGGMTPPRYDHRNIIEVLSPARHRVEFTASEGCRRKLEHARSMMRHTNPKGDLGVIVERALDLLIPRLERERFGKTLKPRKLDDTPAPPSTGDVIPAAIRHAVAERDEYQCTFCSEDGQRCSSRDSLEYDHIAPRALGGEHTVENLRLRCRAHNQLEAVNVFGHDHVEKKIDERRQRKVAESVGAGLVKMGFKKKEVIEALETVAPPMSPEAQRSFEAVFREALAFLTPSPPRQPKAAAKNASPRAETCASEGEGTTASSPPAAASATESEWPREPPTDSSSVDTAASENATTSASPPCTSSPCPS